MLHQFNEKELSITEDDAPILTCYHGGDVARPPYLHPLYAPNGQVVTDDTTIGHQYPPGICFTRGTVNNAQLNHDEITRETEATSARFSIVTTWKNSAEPLLIETCTIEVQPRQTEVQMLDIAISLRCPGRLRSNLWETSGSVASLLRWSIGKQPTRMHALASQKSTEKYRRGERSAD